MTIVFGENLRLLREAENLSQKALAQKLGVTQRKISYWETNKVEPCLEELWDIAEYFHISIEELIGKEKV